MAYLFYLLFFLVPLIFSPQNSELFEYPKMMLTYGLTIIIMATWLIKMILAKKIIYKRTFLEIPLLLYLATHFLSTYFSIDPHVSFWGYYSRFHEGLLASICYVLLYFAAVSNLNKEEVKKIFYVSLFSAAIVSVWAILEHFGGSISCILTTGKFNDDCWVQDVRNRVFATLGQPNWLAAYLNIIIFITIGFKKGSSFKRMNLLFLPLFLAALFFTKSRSGFAGLAAGLGTFVLLLLKINNKFKLAILAIVLILGSYFGIHWYQNLPTPGPGVTDSEAIRKPVWEGAVKVWQRYPVFGSGVETFGYAFYKDRPVSKNLDSEWDFLYNKAHNEYLNILSTTGTVGMIAYLGIIGTFVYKIVIARNEMTKQSANNTEKIAALPTVARNDTLILALFAAYVSILVTNFFGFSVVIIGLYFFLIPAFYEILSD